MSEEATRIEMIFRCSKCRNWFTTKIYSEHPVCPECNGSADYIASKALLDTAIRFNPDHDDSIETETLPLPRKTSVPEVTAEPEVITDAELTAKPKLPSKLVSRPKNIIDWSKWDHLLGSKPDSALAKDIGCHASSVFTRRKKLGVPVNPTGKAMRERMNSKNYDWSKIDPLLGNESDAAIEKITGVNVNAIAKRRKILGISPKYEYSKVDWSKWDHLLGTMTDKDLADQIGCKHTSVYYRRTKLQVEPSRYTKTPDWELIDPYLGKAPDSSLAKKFRCTSYRISQRREKLGIPRWRAKQRDTKSKEVLLKFCN